MLPQPIDIIDLKSHIPPIWPGKREAVTEFELHDASEWRTRFPDHLQQRCINLLILQMIDDLPAEPVIGHRSDQRYIQPRPCGRQRLPQSLSTRGEFE